MKRLGDTVRIEVHTPFVALDRDGMNKQLQETLIAMNKGETPEYAQIKYQNVVLTTPEMVEEYNTTGELASHEQPA